MKVWLVAEGQYSDYSILGVFSTREKAQEYCEVMAGVASWRSPYIDDYSTDDGSMEVDALVGITEVRKSGKKPYRVFMRKNGVAEVKQPWRGEQVAVSSWYIYSGNAGLTMCATIWANDEDHAVKIANEYRSAVIAANRWKDGESSE